MPSFSISTRMGTDSVSTRATAAARRWWRGGHARARLIGELGSPERTRRSQWTLPGLVNITMTALCNATSIGPFCALRQSPKSGGMQGMRSPFHSGSSHQPLPALLQPCASSCAFKAAGMLRPAGVSSMRSVVSLVKCPNPLDSGASSSATNAPVGFRCRSCRNGRGVQEGGCERKCLQGGPAAARSP